MNCNHQGCQTIVPVKMFGCLKMSLHLDRILEKIRIFLKKINFDPQSYPFGDYLISKLCSWIGEMSTWIWIKYEIINSLWPNYILNTQMDKAMDIPLSPNKGFCPQTSESYSRIRGPFHRTSGLHPQTTWIYSQTRNTWIMNGEWNIHYRYVVFVGSIFLYFLLEQKFYYYVRPLYNYFIEDVIVIVSDSSI